MVQFVAANYHKSKRKISYLDLNESQNQSRTHSSELSDASSAGLSDPSVQSLVASSSATSSLVASSVVSSADAPSKLLPKIATVTTAVSSDISTLSSAQFLKSAISNTVTQPYALFEDTVRGAYVIVIHTPTIVSKDQLQISVAEGDRYIIIEGQFAKAQVENGKCKQILSLLPSAFTVNIPLPSEIDVAEVVTTKVDAGISTITIKKAKEVKRKLLKMRFFSTVLCIKIWRIEWVMSLEGSHRNATLSIHESRIQPSIPNSMATPSNTNHNGLNHHSPTPNASPPPPRPPPFPSSRPRQFFQSIWKNRTSLVLGGFVVYATTNYLIQWRRQVIADFISPDTVLHWRITDGSIVETTTAGTTLIKQLGRALEPGAEKHKVSTIYDESEFLRSSHDFRFGPPILFPKVGIMANMSSSSAAQSQANRSAPLGMAQVQELRDAIKEFKETKKAKLGEAKVKVIAFTDTFGMCALVFVCILYSSFGYIRGLENLESWNEIASVPFQIAKHSTTSLRLSIRCRPGIASPHVRGEARKEYKSLTSTFTETSLPPLQHQNLDAVLTTFNENMIRDIAESRCHALGVEMQQAERELTRLIYEGPFLAEQAEQAGLIDGRLYNRQCGALVSTNGAMGLGHYRRVRETEQLKELLKAGPSMVVGIVEAASDETVDAIVLRIDSGGGDVVASDTIADAVKYVKEEKGIPIVASFGNTSASGGYYVSTHCDRIIASPSTLTGSIGVAAIRPYISDEFFKMTGTNVDQIFKGSKAQSMLHDLTGEELERYRRQVDAMYDDFTHRVAEGRHMDLAKVEEVARGKIWAASDAAKVGLVDELGGTYRAVRLAAELGLERLKAERERLLEQTKAPEKQTGPANTDALRRRRAVLMVPDQVGEVLVKVFPAPKPFFQRLTEASTDAVTDAWVRDRALKVGVKLLAFALGEEFERVLDHTSATVSVSTSPMS
ncbi:peptidase family S49-domain-containing protein, partial [Endogone sp. FLAS-F59071]